VIVYKVVAQRQDKLHSAMSNPGETGCVIYGQLPFLADKAVEAKPPGQCGPLAAFDDLVWARGFVASWRAQKRPLRIFRAEARKAPISDSWPDTLWIMEDGRMVHLLDDLMCGTILCSSIKLLEEVKP